jgi:hypothetical protein
VLYPDLPHLLPPLSVINLRPLLGLLHPDNVTSQGRDTTHAQHPDNDLHTPLSLKPSSVVVTTDPTDVSIMVVTSEHREVQHTTVLCHLYKNNIFCPIPTLSCVLAFIANNKGTLNPPASQSAFFKISLSLSLSHSLTHSFASDLRCLV